MDPHLRGVYYFSWVCLVGLPFAISLLKKMSAEPNAGRCSRARKFADERAPLVPDKWSSNTVFFYFVTAIALLGMVFQALVVAFGSADELVVASLMVYNFVSCAWPLCPAQSCTDKVGPQAVVVLLSFPFVVLAFVHYLVVNGEPAYGLLLAVELFATCIDLFLYVPPWDAWEKIKTTTSLTRQFVVDNDQQGYEIED
jgi:hypothetical protein